jgi:hypothetical protein
VDIPSVVDGHELGSNFIDRAVERKRKVDREFEFGEFEDLRDEADGAHSEVAVTEPDFFVEDCESGDDVIEIEEGFSHAHEHDVANAAFGEGLEIEVLGDDFAGGEVAVKTAHSSRAERASHGASDLGADATTNAFFVGEEDGFENLVVAVMDEDFVDVVGAFAVVGKKEGGDYIVFFELFAEVFGEIFEVVEGLSSFFVDPMGDLPTAIGFMPELDNDLFKFGPGFTY